jgi:hypothetical protein
MFLQIIERCQPSTGKQLFALAEIPLLTPQQPSGGVGQRKGTTYSPSALPELED